MLTHTYVCVCVYIYIYIYRWNLEEMVLMNLFTRQKQRGRYREQLFNTVGEGEGGINLESSIDTYTLPYVQQIANGNCYL